MVFAITATLNTQPPRHLQCHHVNKTHIWAASNDLRVFSHCHSFYDSWDLLNLVTWDGDGLGPECFPDKGGQYVVWHHGLMQGLPGRLLAPPFQVDLQPGVVWSETLQQATLALACERYANGLSVCMGEAGCRVYSKTVV